MPTQDELRAKIRAGSIVTIRRVASGPMVGEYFNYSTPTSDRLLMFVGTGTEIVSVENPPKPIEVGCEVVYKDGGTHRHLVLAKVFTKNGTPVLMIENSAGCYGVAEEKYVRVDEEDVASLDYELVSVDRQPVQPEVGQTWKSKGGVTQFSSLEILGIDNDQCWFKGEDRITGKTLYDTYNISVLMYIYTLDS